MDQYMVKEQTTTTFALVPADQVEAYTADGWTEATDEQIAAWQAADAYGGLQGAPPPPPLESAPEGEPPAARSAAGRVGSGPPQPSGPGSSVENEDRPMNPPAPGAEPRARR